MNKRNREIYDDLSAVMRERKERQRIEIISTPTISDKLLAYGMGACAIAGIVLILIYVNNK
jgi:preprotein translocase subunit SecF